MVASSTGILVGWKPKRKDTKIPQSSVPVENVADKAVYKERDASLERATTTATGLDAEQDRGNISKTQSKATPNEPSSIGTSSGGGPRLQDTIGDTIAQTRSENVSKFSNDSLLTGVNTPQSGRKIHDIDANEDITLENVHDVDMLEVHDLDGDEVFVETEEPVVNATTTTSTIPVSAAKDLSDVDIILAQELAKLKSTKPKAVTTCGDHFSPSRICFTDNINMQRNNKEQYIIKQGDLHHLISLNKSSTILYQLVEFHSARKQRPRKPKRKDTEINRYSVHVDNVADEAVYEERDATPNEPSSIETSSGGGPRRQDTMGDTIAQTRSENVSKISNDPLLAGVNTPQSGDYKSEKRVKKLERKKKSRTHGLKTLYKVRLSARIDSSDDEASLGDQEDASKQGRKIHDIDADEDITLENVHDADMFGVHDLDGDEMFLETEEPMVNATTTTSTILVSAAKDLSDVDMTLAQALA
ncbi:hypothetical protein Tco_1247032 [Tanacetum coccineum]